MKHVIFGVLVFTAVILFLEGLVFAQPPVRPDWKERFQAHDKNSDRKIDRAEFQEWMVDAFFQKDIGHKGYLVFNDVKDIMGAEKFRSYDSTGDGKLRLQEFLNAIFQDFELMDVDRNGMITVEEIESYIRPGRK